jgi:hypothetical protein
MKRAAIYPTLPSSPGRLARPESLLASLLLSSALGLPLGLSSPGALHGQTDPGPVPVLHTFDFSKDGGVSFELPRELREISGLATSEDGRVFGHNDEFGRVYEIDLSTGAVTKAFNLGRMAIPGDFEGIAIAGERFFLIASTGDLVEFREGVHGSAVGFRVHSLGLGRFCELEGLAVEEARNALLLPCKTPRSGRLEDHLVVFSVSLDSMSPDPVPRISIPLDELDSAGLGKDFHPSAVVVHPESGSIILTAAREEALLELSPEGKILATKELKRKRHPQPEGLAFLPDGSLVIADEGQGKAGTVTRYAPGAGSGGKAP